MPRTLSVKRPRRNAEPGSMSGDQCAPVVPTGPVAAGAGNGEGRDAGRDLYQRDRAGRHYSGNSYRFIFILNNGANESHDHRGATSRIRFLPKGTGNSAPIGSSAPWTR